MPSKDTADELSGCTKRSWRTRSGDHRARDADTKGNDEHRIGCEISRCSRYVLRRVLRPAQGGQRFAPGRATTPPLGVLWPDGGRGVDRKAEKREEQLQAFHSSPFFSKRNIANNFSAARGRRVVVATDLGDSKHHERRAAIQRLDDGKSSLRPVRWIYGPRAPRATRLQLGRGFVQTRFVISGRYPHQDLIQHSLVEADFGVYGSGTFG